MSLLRRERSEKSAPTPPPPDVHVRVESTSPREPLTAEAAKAELLIAQRRVFLLKLAVDECFSQDSQRTAPDERRKAITAILGLREALFNDMFTLAGDPNFALPPLKDQLKATFMSMENLYRNNVDVIGRMARGEQSLDEQIVVKPSGTDVDLLVKILQSDDVLILPDSLKAWNSELAELNIKILGEEEDKPVLHPTIVLKPEMIPASGQTDPTIEVSLESNRAAASIFCEQLRKRWGELELPSTKNYHESSPQEWFNTQDLRKIADKWQLPFAVEARGFHFVLVLTTPQYDSATNTWSYITYDPLRSIEEKMIFKPLHADCDTLEDFGFENDRYAVSKAGLDLMQSGEYDLRMTDDPELQKKRALLDAKIGKVQFDGYNCGPLCLFAALLRSLFTKRKVHREVMVDAFKTLDMETIPDEISRVLGVRILTREELLKDQVAQKAPETVKERERAFVELFAQTHQEDRAATLKGPAHRGIVVSDGATNTPIDDEMFAGFGGRAATKVVEKAKRLLSERLVNGLRASEAQAVVADAVRVIATWGASNVAAAIRIHREHKNQLPAQFPEEIDIKKLSTDFPINVFPGMATCLIGIRYESIDMGPVWLTCNLGDGFLFLAGPKRADGMNLLNHSASDYFIGRSGASDKISVMVIPALEGDRLVALTDGFESLVIWLAKYKYPTTLGDFFGDPKIATTSDLDKKLRVARTREGKQMFSQPPVGDDKTFGMVF